MASSPLVEQRLSLKKESFACRVISDAAIALTGKMRLDRSSYTTYLCISIVVRLIPIMYPLMALALSLRVRPGHATVVGTLEFDPPLPSFYPASASDSPPLNTADLNLVFFFHLVPCCIDSTGPGLRRHQGFCFHSLQIYIFTASFFSYKFEFHQLDLPVFLMPLYLRSLVEIRVLSRVTNAVSNINTKRIALLA
ncbi:hypothetical protein BGW80DRAFT_711947 [Lactifluus volemus]|nr:hypothetical protein BGW80DRAFT_711947 [Lactifluus volemus]